MQIFMGVTVGLGAGLSFGIICITPQLERYNLHLVTTGLVNRMVFNRLLL